MKTKVVDITPAMAKEWLTLNVVNRPLRPGRVEELRVQFTRGEWKLTHQGIAFDQEGNLADGQHRLTFIASLPEGQSVPVMVTWGVSRDAFFGMDRGAMRSNSDILGKERRLVEVARFMAGIHLGRGNSITPEFLVPFVAIVEDIHTDLISFCGTVCKTWSSTPVRAAAVVKVLAGGDADYVKLVYRAMVTRDYNSMPRIAQSLFTSYLNGGARASDKYDFMCRSLKAFDPTVAERSKVQINDQSKVIASVRVIVRSELARLEAVEAKKKAPAATRGAKGVSAGNYRLEGL